MTKITFYKVALGFSSFSVLLVMILVNSAIHQHRHAQKSFTFKHAPLMPASLDDMPGKNIKASPRVNTFQYFSYTLNDKQEKLKEKLIKRYSLSTQKAEQYTKIITRVSHTYNIPSDLLAALIRTESNYRADAVSHKNAIGPTQIIAKYWKKECTGNLFDISNNIQCAGIILTRYKNRCRDDWDCTLKMYNIGPGNYYKKTKFYQQAGIRYVTKINKNLKLLNG